MPNRQYSRYIIVVADGAYNYFYFEGREWYPTLSLKVRHQISDQPHTYWRRQRLIVQQEIVGSSELRKD